MAHRRWLASCHCLISLSAGSFDTEFHPSAKLGLQAEALAWDTALLRGPSSLHFRQHGRWHKTPPD